MVVVVVVVGLLELHLLWYGLELGSDRESPSAAVGGEPRTIHDKSTIVRHKPQNK